MKRIACPLKSKCFKDRTDSKFCVFIHEQFLDSCKKWISVFPSHEKTNTRLIFQAMQYDFICVINDRIMPPPNSDDKFVSQIWIQIFNLTAHPSFTMSPL